MSVGLVVGNRYELTARIGRGGFGSVWQARDATLRRDVAVKLLEVVPEDRDIIARFWREAQAVASLNHPNIVIAHDFGVVDDSAYLVMELITGGSLADELATRRMAGTPPLDVRRVVTLGTQIAAGLAAAHSAGLVHRDLKPANIMLVRATGAVKIVDFGIAHISDLSRLTKPGGYLGTLPYASPEQMGDGVVDGRSDLYSLGCLLYELLTDHSPYVAESPAQWVAAHQSALPTPIRSYAPTISTELESLIHALLAKDPARRPRDADAVRERLERVPLVAEPRPTLVDSRLLGASAPPVSPAAGGPIGSPVAAGSPAAMVSPAAPGSPAVPGSASPDGAAARAVYAPGRAGSTPGTPGRAASPYPHQAGPIAPVWSPAPGQSPSPGQSPPGQVPSPGQARRPVPAGPGAAAALGPAAPSARRPPGAPGAVASPGGPGQPYYVWTQVATPNGWMAVPHLVNPAAGARRPATVTAAGRVLMALAIACGIEAVIVVAATVRVGQTVQKAFAGLTSDAGTGVVAAMMFVVVVYAIAAVMAGILAGTSYRGSYTGRIWTWLISGVSVLFTLSALGSTDAATIAARPTAADALHPRVVAALAQVRAAVPEWYVSTSRLFDVFALVALLAVIVLIALPQSSAYFQAHRRRKR